MVMLVKWYMYVCEIQEYYMTNIEPAVDNTAQYYLAEIGITNPEKLLTNNPSENLNSQIAEFRHKRGVEAPKELYEQILEFKIFDEQKCRDITMGFYGQGPYRLKEEYKKEFEQPVGSMPSISIQSKEEVIDGVREMQTPSVDPMEAESPAKALKKPNRSDVVMAARDIVESKGIKRVALTGRPVYYSVQDRGGAIHSTSISQQSCTCCSKTLCPHMLAARVHAGLQDDYAIPGTVQKNKLSKLNVKRPKAKHGTKHPIIDDNIHHGVHGTPAKRMRTPSTKPKGPQKPFTKASATSDLESENDENSLSMYASPSPVRKNRMVTFSNEESTQILHILSKLFQL